MIVIFFLLLKLMLSNTNPSFVAVILYYNYFTEIQLYENLDAVLLSYTEGYSGYLA